MRAPNLIISLLATLGLITGGLALSHGQALFPIQKVEAQGTIPCDIGPNVGAVPAEAQQAGLTHCVANFDFSQPAYQVPAFDPSDRAGTWANCRGENNNDASILWHGGSAGLAEADPCDIKQKIDPLDGLTVMNFEWRPTFPNPGGQSNQVSLMTFNQYVGGGPDGRGLPTVAVGNYYVETVNRYETSCGSCASNSGIADVYMYPIPGEYGTEIDIEEMTINAVDGVAGDPSVIAGNCADSNNGGPCWANWGGQTILGIPNFSDLVYHNYGALSTSDGATDKRVCMYIDDVLQNSSGCLVEDAYGVGQPDTSFATKNMIVMGDLGAAGYTSPIEWDVKNIVVWSCANYKQSGAAGQCNGSTLQTSTLPSGQTLAYYK